MIGGGKYDEICTLARLSAKAQGAIVIILRGFDGNGFSCQLPEEYAGGIPDVLRHVADEIERDYAAQQKLKPMLDTNRRN